MRLTNPSQEVWRLLQSAETPDVFFQSWLTCLLETAQIVDSVSGAVLVWADAPNVGPFHPVSVLPEGAQPDPALALVCEQVLEMRLAIQRQDPATGQMLWAAPLSVGNDLFGVVALRMSAAITPRIVQCLQWGMGWLVEHAVREGSAEEAGVRERLVMTLDMLSRVLDGQPPHETAQAIVTELSQRLGCERVSLGFGDLRRDELGIRLFALSHSADFSRRIDLVSLLEQVMAEAADQGETIRLLGESSPSTGLLMVREHRRLQRDFDSTFLISVPFLVAEEAGVFVFEWTVEPTQAEVFALAEMLAPVLGRALVDYRRLSRPWHLRLRESVRHQWQKLIGPYEGKRKIWAGVSLVLVLFLVFAQGTLRVASPAKLEGEVRRVIASPFDGFVASSAFRAGQVVQTGQVLATLDDREIKLEGSRWESEEQQRSQQAQEAQAQHNLAQLQIALAQSRQAQAQSELAQAMLDRSQIRAPFPGVIVSGDLSQQLGAAVKKGQTLYEIAPLDSYRVILDVEEVDMPYVAAGQKGELILAALPSERFPFEVTLVTPVSEAREGKNFFRVEAKLQEHNQHLRPGMEGVGKIHAGQHAIVWVWTHRFFDWMRLQMWVWLGL